MRQEAERWDPEFYAKERSDAVEELVFPVSLGFCSNTFDYEGSKCESRWADRSCWEVETRLYSDSAVAWVQGEVKEVTTLRAVETWNRHRMSS